MSQPAINPDNLSDHDKQMIAIAEGGDPNDPSEVQLPSEQGTETKTEEFKLPEGFKDFDELVAAATQNREKEADEGNEEAPAEGENEEGDQTVDDATSELSDTERELRELKVYQEVGGKENYDKMAKFAKDNLTEDQINIYNAATNGKDSAVAMFAVQGLSAMYELNQMKTFGQEGDMTQAASGGLTAIQGYATRSEMMADMSDPRYQTDELFNQRVAQKLALSRF